MAVLCAVIIATLLTAFLAQPSSRTLDLAAMGATEQILFDPSTAWHDGVLVTSSPAITVSYKFSKRPQTLATRESVEYAKESLVAKEAWGYYVVPLLAGSSASLSVTAVSTNAAAMDLVVVLGHKEYKRFADGKSYETITSAKGLPNATAFEAVEDGEYYFIVDNSLGNTSAIVEWAFAFNKTMFNTTGAKETCSLKSKCDFGVSGDQVVIVEVPASTGFTQTAVIKVEEEFDDGVWWTIFGCVIGFFVLMFIVSLAMCVLRFACGVCHCLFCCCCCFKDDVEEQKHLVVKN